MAILSSEEFAKLSANPFDQLDSSVYGGKIRVMQATIAVNGQQVNDVIQCFRMPKGSRVVFLTTAASVSLGTSGFSIGDPSDTAKFRLATTHTTTTLSLTGSLGASIVNAVGYVTPYTVETIISVYVTAAFITGQRLVVCCFYIYE